MSITVYPAILVIDEAAGTKTWENVVPMQGDFERVKPDYKDEWKQEYPYEPNPEYFPHSSMDMSSGNFYHILRRIGVVVDSTESSGSAEIKEVFEKAHKTLYATVHVADIYMIERMFSLREMARLGIARGATHIVWA